MASISKPKAKELDAAAKRWRQQHPIGRPSKSKSPSHNPSQRRQAVANSGPKARAPALGIEVPEVASRLMDLGSASEYLGISSWTIRKLINRGVLKRVRIPLPKGQHVDRVLLDRFDLDRLIEGGKDGQG